MTKKEKREYDKAYRKRNKKRISEKKALAYKNNPIPAKNRAKKRQEKLPMLVKKEKALWQRNNPIKRKAIVRRDSLKRRGWTEERYDLFFSLQKGKCALCGASAKYELHSRLSADHAHVVPPIPRELLCRLCNTGLGMFRENIKVMKKATVYLGKYKGLK